MRRARAFSLVILLGLFLAVGVFDHEVWSPTEPTVAGVVWNLLESGDWVVPRIDGLPYLEKPPFYYWAAGLAARAAGGLGPGTLRLPAALLGLAGLGALFWVVLRRHGEETAWAAVWLGATTALFYEISHRACTDIAATAFAFGCWAIYARSLGAEPRARRWLDAAFCLLLAASFYAKNFYTFLVVLPPVGAHLLLERRFRRGLLLLGGVAAATVLLVLPWVVGLAHAGGETYLRVVFFDNTLGRFFTFHHVGFEPGPLNNALEAEKQSSPFFYVARLLMIPAPWSLAVVAAVLFLLRQRPLDEHQRFALLGLATVPAVLTLSSSKTTEYLIPVLFFELLVLAELFAPRAPAAGQPSRLETALVTANFLLVGATLVAGPVVVAAALGPAWVAVFSLPLAAGALWLALRWRRAPPGDRPLLPALRAAALALGLVLILAIPGLDAQKSYAPFFETVRRAVAGRPVLTWFRGDHALPLMTYYLRREVRITDLPDIWDALAGPAPVAVVIPNWAYDGNRQRIARMPSVQVAGTGPRGRMVVLLNDAPAARAPEGRP